MNPWIVFLIFFVDLNFIGCKQYTEGDEDTLIVGQGFCKEIQPWHSPHFGVCKLEQPTAPPLCNGSIIHVQWVLTSAQCIQTIKKDLGSTVFFYGQSNSNNAGNPSHFSYNYLHKAFAHENYKISPGEVGYTTNDIGLAKLKDTINVLRQQQPIPIADDQSTTYALRFATFVHWAIQSSNFSWNINASELRTIDQRECTAKSSVPSISDKSPLRASDKIGACAADTSRLLVWGYEIIGVPCLLKDENSSSEWRPLIFRGLYAQIDWIKGHLRAECDFAHAVNYLIN